MESDNESSDDGGGGYTASVSLSSILAGISSHLKNQPVLPSSSSSSTSNDSKQPRKRGRNDDDNNNNNSNNTNTHDTTTLKTKNHPNNKRDNLPVAAQETNRTKRTHTDPSSSSSSSTTDNTAQQFSTSSDTTEPSHKTTIHPSKPEESSSAPINPFAVYIRGIPSKITDSSILRSSMESIGNVQEARIAVKEGVGLGYGFVLFRKIEHANQAIAMGKLSNLRYLPPTMVPHNHQDIQKVEETRPPSTMNDTEIGTTITVTSTTTSTTVSTTLTTDISPTEDITLPTTVQASTTATSDITSTTASTNTSGNSDDPASVPLVVEPKITVGGHRVSIFPCRQDLVEKWLLQPPRPVRPPPKPIVTTAKITSFTPRAVFVKKPSTTSASSTKVTERIPSETNDDQKMTE